MKKPMARPRSRVKAGNHNYNNWFHGSILIIKSAPIVRRLDFLPDFRDDRGQGGVREAAAGEKSA